MKYRYVYVAGPITKGNTLLNIRNGMMMGLELIRRGFVPFVPHNDFIQYILDPHTLEYDTILEQDMAWVERCDALLRLPGESPGADREVAHAEKHGLFVTDSIDVLESANAIAAGV
ncbi:MAG: DUF4406 domain-containing protein [Nitrosopumilus sp.]